MANESASIVQKLWNYCHVLRDDGVSYGDYVEQLTYLLFLKMADEQTKPPFNKLKPAEGRQVIPKGHDWQSLVEKDGDELEIQYRHILETLGKGKGMLGVIFRKSQNRIQDPAKLKRLIMLINEETWVGLDIDVKGEIYEGLLQKNVEDVKRFQEAKVCNDCLGWHKHCKAECCKIVSLNIDPALLETQSEYLIIKVKPMTPSDQRYYRLRDVRYARGTLRFRKDRIHVFGRKVFYIHQCELLDENNLCKGHPFNKPKLCKALTLDTAEETQKGYFVTDNCLFKYKEKGGSNNGRKRKRN